jgi:predicted nucleic acid-binding protein
VPEQAVVNASPLIFLARADRLDFLQQAAPEILVPAEVAAEIGRYGANDPAAQALDKVPWLKTIKAPAVPPHIQAWDLGPGESSVLAYASTAGLRGLSLALGRANSLSYAIEQPLAMNNGDN